MTPELEEIRQEVEARTQDWAEQQWHQAPPGKWTSAQILEHLLLTYTGTTKGLRRVLDGERSLPGHPTWSHRMRKFVVTRLGLMPKGRAAFQQVMPANGISGTTMRHFYDALVAMDATLLDAERRFGKRARLLDHPFLGPLNAQEWRLFHRTHTRHHLRQVAERVSYGSSFASRKTSA